MTKCEINSIYSDYLEIHSVVVAMNNEVILKTSHCFKNTI